MLRRHDLLRARPDGWPEILAAAPAFNGLPDEPRRLVASWADRGWPVIARRRTPKDRQIDTAVGLPLPPFCGKIRLALSIPPHVVAEAVASVSLCEAVSVPANWSREVCELILLGERLALRPALFGALLWQHITRLPYLQPGSDIDLLWPTPTAEGLTELLDNLARLDEVGPARLDGEIVLAAGGCVHWRELRRELCSPGGAVLVKSVYGADIRCARALFA